MKQPLRLLAAGAAALLLAGCTAGLGSEITTEPDSIVVAESSAVDEAIAAAEARSAPYMIVEGSGSPTDADMQPYQAADAADALRRAVGLDEQPDGRWEIFYDAGGGNGESRALYTCQYTNGREGQGVQWRFMALWLDAVTGALQWVNLYWPDGIEAMDDAFPLDYEQMAQAGRDWLQSEGITQEVLDFAAALGYACTDCITVSISMPEALSGGSIAVGSGWFRLTAQDGRTLRVIVDPIARKPCSLEEISPESDFSACTWADQDDNGNWHWYSAPAD